MESTFTVDLLGMLLLINVGVSPRYVARYNMIFFQHQYIRAKL